MKTIISMRMNGERWQVVNVLLQQNVTCNKKPGFVYEHYPYRIYRNRKLHYEYQTLNEAIKDFTRIINDIVLKYK